MGRTFFHHFSWKGLAPFSYGANRNRQRLRGQAQILESTLVKVVIAFSIIATVGVFTAQMGQTKTQQMRTEVNFFVDLVQRLYSIKADYSGLTGSNTLPSYYYLPSIPKRYVSGATLINAINKNPIDGRVVFTNPNEFFITTTVPSSYCVDMATMDLGPRQVGVIANSISNLGTGPTAPNAGPMSTSVAIQNCANATSPVTISWFMR